MTCYEVSARLYDYLDHELVPREEAAVREHLRDCGDCLERFSFERRLLMTIRDNCRAVRAPERLQRQIVALINRR
jgi:mycothiol system anti-sigma-R factor